MIENFPFKKILVVDDSEVDFFLVHQNLKMVKPVPHILHAMDVDSGLNVLRSFRQSEMPDLVLLDLYFNRHFRQGRDFLHEFHRMPKTITCGTKIKVLSAYTNPEIIAGLEKDFGKMHVIEKPIAAYHLIT